MLQRSVTSCRCHSNLHALPGYSTAGLLGESVLCWFDVVNHHIHLGGEWVERRTGVNEYKRNGGKGKEGGNRGREGKERDLKERERKWGGGEKERERGRVGGTERGTKKILLQKCLHTELKKDMDTHTFFPISFFLRNSRASKTYGMSYRGLIFPPVVLSPSSFGWDLQNNSK